jgi:hypothetical protein
MEGRKVVYRITPEGLIVEVGGVKISPKATSVRNKDGSFGIRFDVSFSSEDDEMHELLVPTTGVLSIAGKVIPKSGEPREFSDSRSGEDVQFVTPGDALSLTQSWPRKGGPKMWWGEEVELQVGLWGLALPPQERLPVRKLFVVKMVAGNGATPVITPPKI